MGYEQQHAEKDMGKNDPKIGDKMPDGSERPEMDGDLSKSWFWSSTALTPRAHDSFIQRLSEGTAYRTYEHELRERLQGQRDASDLATQQEKLEKYWREHAASAEVCPKIGDEMPDGTTLAGISPDTGEPMYVPPADAPLMEYKRVKGYVKGLNRETAYDHKDWRSATKGELRVLFECSAAIGGFTDEYHWGGTIDVGSGGGGFRNPIFESTFKLPYALDFGSGRGGAILERSCAFRPVRG
jgi:hypothetical protein